MTLVSQGSMAKKENTDREVIQVSRETEVPLDLRASRVPLEREKKVKRGQMVNQVKQVCQGIMEKLDHRERRVSRDLQERKENQEKMEKR